MAWQFETPYFFAVLLQNLMDDLIITLVKVILIKVTTNIPVFLLFLIYFGSRVPSHLSAVWTDDFASFGSTFTRYCWMIFLSTHTHIVFIIFTLILGHVGQTHAIGTLSALLFHLLVLVFLQELLYFVIGFILDFLHQFFIFVLDSFLFKIDLYLYFSLQVCKIFRQLNILFLRYQ